MKIPEYIVIRNENNNCPTLKEKNIIKWDKDFLTYDNIIDFLNKNFYMNILEEEYVYVISFNCQMKPQGIFQLSQGMADTSLIGTRELAIFLLLTGANKFILAHNHPNGDSIISNGDIKITNMVMKMSKIIGIEFVQHFVISNDEFEYIIYDEENDEQDDDELEENNDNKEETIFGIPVSEIYKKN